MGDISYNFQILKIFFDVYCEEIWQHTFFVLGNHELWDSTLNQKCKTIDEIVDEYRKFFAEKGITLLENQLYLPNDKKALHNINHILSEEEILNLSDAELIDLFTYNGYAIFGGLGYAGFNTEFNFNQGIYRNAQIDRLEEIERSKRVEKIHKKLKNAVPDKKIFFVTHMPKSDWSSTDDYVENWVYISGHTHKNFYCKENGKRIYSDNQVGYTNQSYNFKFLLSSYNFNPFCDYKDGIHEITRDQYKLFYYGLGNWINFNRKFEKLYMIKRNEAYCFLIQLKPNDNLKLLNGGSIKNVGKHDLKYFYDNLPNYITSIKRYLTSYNNFQKQVATEIRKIGGSGRIHGSIVDIDFYNHLYINPRDATITPYFAYSMTEKYVYTNLISLLKENRNDLYLNYKKLIDSNNQNNTALMILNDDLNENLKSVLVPETEIYKVSRILIGLQYTTKYNIVRLWNDTIASDCSAESGKLIVSGILNPEEMKAIQREEKRKEREAKLKATPIKLKKEKVVLTEEQKRQILFDNHSKKIAALSNNTIKVIIYDGAKEKAEYKYLNCGHKWNQRADHFLSRRKGKCPKCQK